MLWEVMYIATVVIQMSKKLYVVPESHSQHTWYPEAQKWLNITAIRQGRHTVTVRLI
jgi:hypothetical protein